MRTFFFCFSLLKTTKICFGSTKMAIFYREKAFHAGKKIRKNDFAPSEKYACYAPVGEMNQNILHSKNNIGSTLLSNNAASDVSEWFLEWFWSRELLCLRLLFTAPISFIRWCISFHYNQNLAPDRKKIPAPRENYPVPDPTRFLDPGPDRSPV